MRFLLLFFLVSSPLSASTRWMVDFNESLSRNLWLKSSREYSGKRRFFLAHPSLAKRWGLINSSAEATYNGFLNTIEIKEESTIKEPGQRTRLKTIEELKKEKPYVWSVGVATIFHEIGHAEFDIFVENEVTAEDEALWHLVKTKIRPWFKKNHPRSNASVAVSELFAYFRTDVIETFNEDIQSVFIENGINHFKERCFKPRRFKALAPTMTEEEFSHFLGFDSDPKLDLPYRERIDPGTVYVSGKSLHLHKAKQPFKKEWLHAIWDHFAAFHNPPASKRELIKRMDEGHPLKDLLVGCRGDLYHELVGTSQAEKESSEPNPTFENITQ
ncbi:hypothetical protein HOF92_11890 [bacterium]|nr:hypothetical protein [bacterium]